MTPTGSPVSSRNKRDGSADPSLSRPDEAGASLVEYALLIALIAVVCVVGIVYFGGSVGDSLSRSGSSIVGRNP